MVFFCPLVNTLTNAPLKVIFFLFFFFSDWDSFKTHYKVYFSYSLHYHLLSFRWWGRCLENSTSDSQGHREVPLFLPGHQRIDQFLWRCLNRWHHTDWNSLPQCRLANQQLHQRSHHRTCRQCGQKPVFLQRRGLLVRYQHLPKWTKARLQWLCRHDLSPLQWRERCSVGVASGEQASDYCCHGPRPWC